MSAENPTMFELAEDMRALEELLAQEEEGTFEDADVVAKWLEELDAKLEDKADRVAAVIRVLDERCASREAEANRLEALATTDARARDRLKARLLELLAAAGRKSVDTKHYRITVAGNGGKVPVIVDEGTDPATLPADYVRVIPERRVVDTDAVRAALEGGASLTFARLGERGRHLRIR